MAPGTLISILPEKQTIQLTSGYEFNFDDTPYCNKSTKENASNLVSLFSESCETRAHICPELGQANVLALSGGLDSRSVAACLAVNKIPFTAVTRLDSSKMSLVDAHIAKILAARLSATWRSIDVGSMKAADILTLLRLKSGMNPLGVASRVQFLDRLQSLHGSGIVFFTGDGGDKVFCDLRPSRTVRTFDALIRYIISQEQIFELSDVSLMTGMHADDIVHDIRTQLSKYPEVKLAQKYIHFLMFERAFKWLFEGEDRNRCYFWSVAPFYSIPLFI
ncbi:MAG: asparagine synthase-related protein, partial [Nitrososphaeraceae archaeon]